MTQEDLEQKKSVAKWIAIGIFVVAIVIVGYVAFTNLNTFVNRPNPDVTKLDVRSGFEGFDYFVYSDVRVVNNGGEGYVKVYCELQGSMYEEQNQRIYMAEGATKELTFKYDVGFLESVFTSENCKVWAIAD